MCRTFIMGSALLALLFSAGLIARADNPTSPLNGTAAKSPLSPEESLKHFVLADPNLQIEIVAAEPEVIDPVAIQFDEHGRLWVVEMRDYPTGPKEAPPLLGGPDAKPLSRIKLLEDKDGDGRFETAHVFADNLLFATGVQPWDGGVIVTLAGEVAYFKDTDGDHKADVRETWFTGFAQANTQLRANHPTFGPDGWIYVANGLRGGNVIAVKKDWPVKADGERGRKGDGEKDKSQPPSSPPLPLTPSPPLHSISHDPANPRPVSLTGRDFKFDPLTGRYEAISGNGQFGLTFDAWGNRFVCDNRHPCRHVIFEEDFIKRCPHVAFPAVVNDVIPPDDKNKVFPLTSAWTTSNLHAGTFTASCGVTVYTGDWLPEEFRGNVFVCEPTGNLVQRAILEPDGVTFKSRNPYARSPVAQSSPVAPRQEKPNPPTTPANKSTPNGQSESTARSADLSRSDRATGTQEFLASRDDWFRPVDLQNGPDGALYVVDMYRAVIEHPEWVPDELKKRPDTWLGNDMGRIYRIRPKDQARQAMTKQTVPSDADKLVEWLDSPNGWNRITAVRRLAEKFAANEKQLVGLIEQEWRPKSPLGLTIAMQIRPHDFAAVKYSNLQDLFRKTQDHWCRSQILRVSGRNGLHEKEWLSLTGLARIDPHPRVRFEMNLQFPHIPGSNAEVSDAPLQFWGRQTFKDLNDPWLRLAMFGNLDGPSGALFEVAHTGRATWMGQGGLVAMRMLGEMWATWKWKEETSDTPVSPEQRLEHLLSRHMDRFLFRHEFDGPISPLKGINPEGFDVAANFLCGLANGFQRRGVTTASASSKLTVTSRDILNSMLKYSRKAIVSEAKPPAEVDQVIESRRLLAVEFLRFGTLESAGVALKEIIATSSDHKLRLAALDSLTSFPNHEVGAWLIERYRSETPAIRRAILAALFASKERQLRLLEAIEQGQIAATELDPVRVNQLTQAKDETLRERAKTVLAAAAPASRHEVLDAYRPALALTADPKRGREVFVKNCSTCHRVDNVGVNVAPDISDTRTKKPEQLLLDILDPNKAIDANYFAYAVVTKEGKTESGVITSETATSITLKQPEGKVLTLLRTDIDELRNTGLSLMPIGVEKNIDQQAMADLIYWLKNWRYLDGKVPATSLK